MRRNKIMLLLAAVAVILQGCSGAEKTSPTEQTEAVTAQTTEYYTDTEQTEAVTAQTTEYYTETQTAETEGYYELYSAEYLDLSDTEKYSGETKTIGGSEFGYIDVPADWSESVMYVIERPAVSYDDGNGNSISMWYEDGNKSIDELAYISFIAHDANSVSQLNLKRAEINGFKAYRFSYMPSNDKYCSMWLLECADGINRGITFTGKDTGIYELSNMLIKTYKNSQEV